MMTDIEIAQAIRDLSELTADGKIGWVREADDSALSTDELDPFVVTIRSQEDGFAITLALADGSVAGEAEASPGDTRRSTELAADLYALFYSALPDSSSEASAAWQDAVAKKRI